MRGGGREVEAGDRRLRPAESRNRPEDELLVELRRAAVKRATDEVRVARVQVRRHQHVTPTDQGAKSRRELLDALLDPLGEPLGLARPPLARELACGVA